MSALLGGTAVITGGAGQAAGLGRGLVKKLSTAGMKVAVLDLDEDAAEQLVQEVEREGGEGFAIRVDVLDPESLRAAAHNVEERYGSCNVLCAHVGGGGQGRFLDLPLDAWHQAMELMVIGTVATIQAFLPLMQRSGGARRVVLTSSVAALAPGRFQGPYRGEISRHVSGRDVGT